MLIVMTMMLFLHVGPASASLHMMRGTLHMCEPQSLDHEAREKTVQVHMLVSWVRVARYDDNGTFANPSQEKGQMLGKVEAICRKGCRP